MRVRNSTAQQLSLLAPGREKSRCGTVQAGWFLESGAIFESAAAQIGKEAWIKEDELHMKSAQRAAEQALFAAAFEKTTLELVC